MNSDINRGAAKIRTSAHRTLTCSPIRRMRSAKQLQTQFHTSRFGQLSSNYDTVRCMASANDKSWGELAGDALHLVKTAATKVVDSVSETASKLLPGQKSSQTDSSGRESWHDSDVWNRTRDPFGDSRERRAPAFLRERGRSGQGGFLARGLEGLMQNAFENLEQELRKQTQGSAELREEALAAVQNDYRVQQALGSGVRIIPGMDSQSVQSSYINGKVQKQTTLGFLIRGSNGTSAQAQATRVEGSSNSGDMNVQVQLPNGQRLQIDSNARFQEQPRSKRDPIDVEWSEVK